MSVTIKTTTDGSEVKVITRDGKPSCSCCGGSCALEWNTDVHSETTNPWAVSMGGNRIRFDIEDSENCGGYNSNTQTGTATATITVGASDMLLDMSISGIAEEQDTGYENLSIYLNGVRVASATSPGTKGALYPDGTCEMGPAVITYDVTPPYPLAASSVNTLSIEMDTHDNLYHVSSYYQVDFSCSLAP